MRQNWDIPLFETFRFKKRNVPIFFLCVACLVACAPAGPRSHEYAGFAMGTTWSVKVIAPPLDPEAKSTVEETIVAELNRVDERMSHYRPDSELSRFNRSGGTTPFPMSSQTLEVIVGALETGDATGGALDVTVGPLVDVWGFGPPVQPVEPPSESTIETLLRSTGQEHLQVDLEAGALRKDSPEVRIDLSSIAKGYSVDRIAEALDGLGYTRYLVEVGGELRVRGTNETGRPWRLAVERPQDEGRAVHRVVSLSEGSMATSGDYRNWYEADGRRVSHILDPRTGRPIEHRLASVSVVEPRCLRADALATALYVLGPDEGYAWAIEHDLAALFLVREEDGSFTQKTTPAFEALLSPDG